MAFHLKNPENIYTELLNQFEANRDLENFISLTRNKVNTKLAHLLKHQQASCDKLQAALEYTTLSGGKRLRALLLYAVADLIINNKPTSQPVLNSYILNSEIDTLLLHAACSIELIHTYSLVHDDLPCLDDDDLRRNQPSCHKQFDEATALLVGDALQTMAFDLLSQPISTNSTILAKQLKIINILSQASGAQGMVGGQSLELNLNFNQLHSSKTAIGLSHYLEDHQQALNKVHLLKTGKLFTAALQIAAVITDCETTEYDALTRLGEIIGLIFQIQDDILDYNQDLESDTESDTESNTESLLTEASHNYVYSLGLARTEKILTILGKESADLMSLLKATDSFFSDLFIAIYQSGN